MDKISIEVTPEQAKFLEDIEFSETEDFDNTDWIFLGSFVRLLFSHNKTTNRKDLGAQAKLDMMYTSALAIQDIANHMVMRTAAALKAIQEGTKRGQTE